jgi:hypothetical protein
MKIELIAETLGFKPNNGTFTRTFSGYEASLVMYKIPSSYVKLPMILFAFSKMIDKESMKKIAKVSRFKGAIKESVALRENAILTKARFGKREQFEAHIEKLISVFQELNLKTLDYCPYCGNEDTDSIRVIKGAPIHVHDECVKNFVKNVTTHLETVGSSKNKLLKSVLFAIVGGFLGLLPSIIILSITGFYSAWLFLIIPYAAFSGFKKGGAQPGSYVMFIITAISFILAPGFMLYAYIDAAQINDYTFAEALQVDEFRSAFIKDVGMTLLFTGIAVAVSWKSIFKQTHGQIKKDIEDLK